MNNLQYNIGLDIGVGSVGWCVTNKYNEILKRNTKNMWGARIFSEANTAATRRNLRASKRRLNRRKERINILQSIMLEDIEKEFPNFFPMLRETSLNYEDKKIAEAIFGKKHNLFSEINNTDSNYYGKFKTIYHLRKYLITTKERVDIRLVYLAIHHIIKYRGNFLYEGDFSENSKEINENINEILEFLKENYEITINANTKELFDILKQTNITKAAKKEKIISLFDFDKTDKQVVVNLVKSFLGYSTDLNKIFNLHMEKNEIKFSEEIENEEEIKEELQEYSNIFENMSNIYSWFILQNILKGNNYISEAFIEKYNKYEKDLKVLKNIYKTYYNKEYSEMFRKIGKDNYVAYNGKTCGKNCKKCKPVDFFKTLKKKIEALPDECIEKVKILEEIENHEFLVKLNVTDNGTIPHQLHQRELEIILNNQSKYYPTLQENKDNIIKLFSFRIPYYVGPLSKSKGKWSWIERKDGNIRPWNFEQIVDIDSTAEAFIKRMTNKCTYLINENVMPKKSLLYSKYCVLNELNNIKVDGRRLDKNTKRNIIEHLFKKKKKVTAKDLKDFYKLNGHDINEITGLTDKVNFNSNMSSYIDMKNIFSEEFNEDSIEEYEEIIYWITIFEDKKILKRKIKQKYTKLTDKQIEKLCKLKYTGWSRLSKKLIAGIKSNDGETIMDKLESTTLNFMQIINNKEYNFDKIIEESTPKNTGKIQISDIEEIPTSPANKRAIWQSICVVKEIIKIMKKGPSNIYIEFARSEESDKKMKDGRIDKLLSKYEDIEHQLKYLKNYDKDVYFQLKKQQSNKTLNEKMYLYYLQNGKCLYSGKPLDLENLNLYEVDHIIPRSYIKDDSIDNKALVLKEENQRKTDNLLLKDYIINSRISWWKSLLENNLMSQSKYNRLIRRKMFETDNDREKFVERQLVETRQITKHVTNLLKNQYANTSIFSLRAELTHGFRSKYKIYKNRNVNNYHHAQDAYIISTIGNILDENWKGTGSQFKYSEYVKKYMKDNKTPKEKYGIVLGFISKYVDIKKITKVINYKDCFISRMLEEQTGEFYNQTLYSPNNKPAIPLKENRIPEKYGGYSNENKAYYVIFKYINKNNKIEYQLIGIPIKVAYDIKSKKNSIENYIKTTYLNNTEYSNFEIIRNKVLKNQEYLDENQECMRLCSDSEIRSNKELVVDKKMQRLIYLMNTNINKLDDNEIQEVQSKYSYMFNYLLEKLQKEYKVFNSTYKKLINKIEEFQNLKEEEKKLIINGLIDLMKTGQCNLKGLGLSDREGRKSGKILKTNQLLKMTFIDKSVTGMYERRFKIDGMENSNY